MMQRRTETRRSVTGVPIEQGLGNSVPVVPPQIMRQAVDVLASMNFRGDTATETPPIPAPQQFGDCPPDTAGGGGVSSALLSQMIAVLGQINSGIQTLVQEAVKRDPLGVVIEMAGAVTQTAYNQPLEFNPPLFSVTIANEGTNDLVFRIPNNPSASDCVLHAGQNRIFSFGEGVVETMGLRITDNSLPTNVRITGGY